MNIHIPYKWLKEFLETSKTATELAELLPLHGPQVEKVIKNENLQDDVLEIEITPNRVDMASVVGIAREASAITGETFLYKDPTINLPNEMLYPLKVKIDNETKCFRYCALIVDNVKVQQSPKWLKERLEALGHRSINLLVDISNYVLLELGYPTHIFDYHKISGNEIIVRNAKKGETIITLDKEKKILTPNDLVIADKDKAIAIAGIKGGIDTAVDENTTTVVIEAANFEPYGIRKTARRIDLHTSAASLFEKGLSPISAEVACLRVAELILQLSKEAKIVSPIQDIATVNTKQPSIDFNIDLNKKLLGIELSKDMVITILTKLGFECIEKNNKIINVKVPHFRNDIKYDFDLVEEIVRIYGYDKIPSRMLKGEIPNVNDDEIIEWENKIRDLLVGAGLTEQFSVSMVGDQSIELMQIDPDDLLQIANPLSVEYKYMRTELISTMINTFKNNENYKDKIQLFELNMIYLPIKDNLPKEIPKLAIGINGKRPQEIFQEVKGYFEHIFKSFGYNTENINYKLANIIPFEKNASATIVINNDNIGKIGILSDKVMEKLGIKNYVCILEANFLKIIEILKNSKKSFKPIPKFPPIKRDYAFLIEESIQWANLYEQIKATSQLITKIELFDIYKGKGIEKGHKSIAFRVFYQHPEKTLTDEEIEDISTQIINNLSTKFKATLRSK
jgi:phenylalanyl-tRNA synthetase beta chain